MLWEAGVIIELPPWVVALYPSSLLYHFNVDISGKPCNRFNSNEIDRPPFLDFQFVAAPERELPTPENSSPLGVGCEEGRGSLVYFNEAGMHQSSETGFPTLGAAVRGGHSGKTNYTGDIQQCFEQHVQFVQPSGTQ